MSIAASDEVVLGDVIARVPELARAASVSTSTLHGGLSNANYLVEADGAQYVVRIGCENWKILGIDRSREEAAERMAVSGGIAPESVAFFHPEGHSVTRFLPDAHAVQTERFTSPEMVPRMCGVLRDVHALAPIEGVFDPFLDIDRWDALLDKRREARPSRLGSLLDNVTATGLVRRSGVSDLVLCHNDPYHLNFLDDGSRLWLIDWEYAGMGNRMYDLAGIGSVLDADGCELLLESYFGDVDSAVRRELDAYIEVYVCWNVMWCLIQVQDSTIAHDYAELAEQFLNRLER